MEKVGEYKGETIWWTGKKYTISGYSVAFILNGRLTQMESVNKDIVDQIQKHFEGLDNTSET